MLSERKIIQLLLGSDLPSDISAYLASHGFFNADGHPFSQTQVNSFMHSVRQEERKQQYKRVERCGIDREKNPCGDASDY